MADRETTSGPADVELDELGRRPTWLLVLAAVAIVAGVAVVAVVASGDDDGGEGSTESPVAAEQPAPDQSAPDQPAPEQNGGGSAADGGLGSATTETRPVIIDGDPLPPLDGGDDGATGDPAVGAVAPMIEGQSFDGSTVTIGGARDAPTLVVYVAHWCPACNAEIAELVALGEQGGLPADLEVVAVSTAVREGEANYPPSQWLADVGWAWPSMADDPDATAFLVSGGTQFPYTMVLDTDGTVLARSSGSKSADEISAFVTESLAAG